MPPRRDFICEEVSARRDLNSVGQGGHEWLGLGLSRRDLVELSIIADARRIFTACCSVSVVPRDSPRCTCLHPPPTIPQHGVQAGGEEVRPNTHTRTVYRILARHGEEARRGRVRGS